MKGTKKGDRTGPKAKVPTVATSATSATGAASEWGIPDWRDPASYGDFEKWSDERWHWEFTRRRTDVREFFDQWAASAYAENQLPQPTPPARSTPKERAPHESGFMVECIREEPWRLGMRFVPNPRIGLQPHYQFFFDPMRSIATGWRDESDVNETLEIVTTGWREGREVNAPVEVVLSFRLDQPLEPQLKEARNYLRISQRANYGKLLQLRPLPEKWLLYLRALDARAAGASLRDIAKALLPKRIDEAGDAADAREQKARDVWEAADALRFNF
jgi:hypothetical protein